MPTPKTSERVQLDDASNAMLYEGVSPNQAAALFGMDIRDVKERIGAWGIKPVGQRGKSMTYLVKDLAPALAKKAFTEQEVEMLIKKMGTTDLPPILKKEYWAAMRSRQLFEKEQATLVKADEVVQMIGDLFKTLRMSLLLARDLVERETELTDRQRYIVTENIDRALESAHAEIVRRFGAIKDHAAHQSHVEVTDEDDDEL